MTTKYGTTEEHLATLKRAKQNNVLSVWSGDVARNPYLQENLKFGVDSKILKLTTYDSQEDQESGWLIEWLDNPILEN